MASTSTKPATEHDDLALKFREQVVSTVQQGQQLTLDATRAWVKAVSVLPVPDLPTVPGVPALDALPSVEASTTFAFDLAADLLTAQRDFALRMANVLVPEKSV